MLTDSGLMRDLQQQAHGGQPMCPYGDPAYPLRVHVLGPFRFGVLSNEMKVYSTATSTERSSVEWLFGGHSQLFQVFGLKEKFKTWTW